MTEKSIRRKFAEPPRKISYVKDGKQHRVEIHNYIAMLVKNNGPKREAILRRMIEKGCQWSESSLSLITDLQNGKMKLPFKELVYFIDSLDIKSKKEKRTHILRILSALVPENLSGYIKQVDKLDEYVAERRCWRDKAELSEMKAFFQLSTRNGHCDVKINNDGAIKHLLKRALLLEVENNSLTAKYDDLTIHRCKKYFQNLTNNETQLLTNLKPEQPILPKLIDFINEATRKKKASEQYNQASWDKWRELNKEFIKEKRQELVKEKLHSLNFTSYKKLSNEHLQGIEEHVNYFQEQEMYEEEYNEMLEIQYTQEEKKVTGKRNDLLAITTPWLSSLDENMEKDIEIPFDRLYVPYYSAFNNKALLQNTLENELAENNDLLPFKIMKLIRKGDFSHITSNREFYEINSIFDFVPDYIYLARLIQRFNNLSGTDFFGDSREVPSIHHLQSLKTTASWGEIDLTPSMLAGPTFMIQDVVENTEELMDYCVKEVQKNIFPINNNESLINSIGLLIREYQEYLTLGEKLTCSFWDNLNLSYPKIEKPTLLAQKVNVACWLGKRLPAIKTKPIDTDDFFKGFNLGDKVSIPKPPKYLKDKVINKDEITMLFEASMRKVENKPTHWSLETVKSEILKKNKSVLG